MAKTKFIYFDVGGVLILDYSGTNKWIEMKRDLGITEDQDLLFDDAWSENRESICLDCDVDTLIPKFESVLGFDFPIGYSMLDDFVNRFEKNNSIWNIAKKAKEKYTIGLLTNMYPRMLERIIESGLLPDIEWDVIIDSSIVGYKKPQSGMYQIAQTKSGYNGEEILFIDNQQRHLDSAMKLGWKTLLYDPQNIKESNDKLEKEL